MRSWPHSTACLSNALPAQIVTAAVQAMATDSAFQPAGADQQRLGQLQAAAQHISTSAMGWPDPEILLPRRDLPADAELETPAFASQLSQPTASQPHGLTTIFLRASTLSMQQLSVRRANAAAAARHGQRTCHTQCIDEAWGGVERAEGAADDDLTGVQPMLTTIRTCAGEPS